MPIENKPSEPQQDRRNFLKRALATGLGVAGISVPACVSVSALLDPLGRKGGEANFVRVTTLDAIPPDGQPRRFQILADRFDGWTRFSQQAVGAVYLRRIEGDQVEALNVICPHAGCHVSFKDGNKAFHCPCHDSRFSLSGALQGENNPSPRAMDTLPVEVRVDSAVWVRFQNFRTGTAEKVPLA